MHYYCKDLQDFDFKVGIDEPHMKSFVKHTFQRTCVMETGLSDFHLLTLTIMRKTFKKQRPRIINYRPFKHFSNEEFRKLFQ